MVTDSPSRILRSAWQRFYADLERIYGCNDAVLREDIDQEPMGGEHKRNKVVETTKFHKESYGVRNIREEENNVTIQRNPKILGVVAATISENNLGKNIYQEPRKQSNEEENKSESTESSSRKECKSNKNGDVAMSWLEYFSNELMDGIKLIEEEEIQLDPNQFNKELLWEHIDPKYMKNA